MSGFSIDVDKPYDLVVQSVREVASNGVILGTFEYKGDPNLPGAEVQRSCKTFAPWKGPGEVLFKVRGKTLAPAHFVQSNDVGTVAVRYVVQPLGPNSTRLFLDAAFVEDSGHRGHASDGMVESAEFGAIGTLLRAADRQRLLGQESSSQENPQPELRHTDLPPAQVIDSKQTDDLHRVVANQTAELEAAKSRLQELESRVERLKAPAGAYVAVQRAELKSQPYAHATVVAALHQEAELTVLARASHWYRVRSAQGQEGWIERRQVESEPAMNGFASVKQSGTGVMTRTNDGGPVLFRARAEDEFQVVRLQGDWAEVRLAADSTGWIRASELELPTGVAADAEPPASHAATAAPAPAGALLSVAALGEGRAGPDLGFVVSHESVREFSGDWAPLKGRKALFVYAQPRGLLAGLGEDSRKLRYAERIFAGSYHNAARSAEPFAGVVVIFMGGHGGVAAATISDTGQWVMGKLGEDAFVGRCSLDPLAEFQGLRAMASPAPSK